MTTRTYFMKSFNLIMWLLLLSPVCCLFGWLFHHIATQFSTVTILNLKSVITVAYQLSSSSYLVTILSLSSALILTGVEIGKRLKEDTLWNYVTSIYHTFSLRNFLFQREKVQKVGNLEYQTVTTMNPINNGFNRAARRCVVDIRADSVMVFIKIPKDQQGQKVLNDMTSQLKEEVSSQHPDYYFSAPNRVRNNLWLVGKRR